MERTFAKNEKNNLYNNQIYCNIIRLDTTNIHFDKIKR